MILLVHFDIRDWKSRCSKSPTCIGTTVFFYWGGDSQWNGFPLFQWLWSFLLSQHSNGVSLHLIFFCLELFIFVFLFTCPPRSSYFYLVCGLAVPAFDFVQSMCIRTQARLISSHAAFRTLFRPLIPFPNFFCSVIFLYKFVILFSGFFFKVTEVWSLFIYLMQERGWWFQPNCLIYPPAPPPAVGRYIVPDRRLASAVHIGDICLCAVPPLRCP